MQNWFETWFNSSYYHLLYNNRNDAEAQFFIDNLINYLHPEKDSKILDMACGKGRHSKYLATKGFDVCGIDLAKKNAVYVGRKKGTTDDRNKVLKKHNDIVTCLQSKMKVSDISRITEKTRATIYKVKKML